MVLIHYKTLQGTDLFKRCFKHCATTCVKGRCTLGLHFSGEGVFVRRLALYIVHLKSVTELVLISNLIWQF